MEGLDYESHQQCGSEKCDRYKQHHKIRHRPELENDSDFTIMGLYQGEYRGIAEYYRLAYNLHTLDLLKWVMEVSLTKTLAHKHKTSVQKMCDKYKTEWEENGRKHRGLRVVIPRAGKNPLIATWGGISLQWDVKATLNDQPHIKRWDAPNWKNACSRRYANNVELPA